MPIRFETIGDPHAAADFRSGSLEKLLELANRDEVSGLGDAPWPPHFRKMEGEAKRVTPSKAKASPVKSPSKKSSVRTTRAKAPLLTVANSSDESAALAGLERWKDKYPDATKWLAVDDVLVDRMRGRSSTWTRIRVNLRHVPEEMRPSQEIPDPDDDPTRVWRAHKSKQIDSKKSPV